MDSLLDIDAVQVVRSVAIKKTIRKRVRYIASISAQLLTEIVDVLVRAHHPLVAIPVRRELGVREIAGEERIGKCEKERKEEENAERDH